MDMDLSMSIPKKAPMAPAQNQPPKQSMANSNLNKPVAAKLLSEKSKMNEDDDDFFTYVALSWVTLTSIVHSLFNY